MALIVNTGSVVSNAASDPDTAYEQLLGNSWSGATYAFAEYTQWGVSSVSENEQLDGIVYGYPSGSWTSVVGPLTADKTYKFRAKGEDGVPSSDVGTTKNKKTGAVAPTASTPTSSDVTATTATIACNYYPNVLESTCSAQLQYKKTANPNWTDAGSPGTLGGYVQRNVSVGVTGLASSTQYSVRLVITRTTSTGTTLTSATHSFTTLAGVPAVTTDAATDVAAVTANLNGTLDINSGEGVDCYFKWGTDNPPTQYTTADQPMTADGSFQQPISGLTISTTYYCQAFASFTAPSGSPVSGSVVSFVTTADPEDPALEDHVLTFSYDAKYGVQTIFAFCVASPSASSSNLLVTTAPGSLFAANDVKVSKDGAAAADAANLATISQVTNAPQWYLLTLTAAEMQATNVYVRITDAAGGPNFRDTVIHIRTKIQVGQIDADATQVGGNTPGMTVTGVGTSPGLIAVGGATASGDITGRLTNHVLRASTIGTGGATPTLDSGASSTAGFYVGCIIAIISGTGAGQARVITGYTSGRVVTPNKAFSVNPATSDGYIIIPGPDVWTIGPADDLDALPTEISPYGDFVQMLFQRFAYQITQTATLQTWFDKSNVSIFTRSVSDDLTTQTVGKLT